MTRSYPPDVIVLENEVLLHARIARGPREHRLVHAKSYRLPSDTFAPAQVTPALANETALSDVLRRLRLESGRWEKVSLLLPDSWFRINLLEVPSLPEKSQEAAEVIRWSLKRTTPINPSDLRLAWEVLSRKPSGASVLAVSAVEKTIATIESLFRGAGCEVVLIEPVGFNIWNAITMREAPTNGHRLFFYVRRNDFTTAVFQGSQPLFIRSRNLDGGRSLIQEMRLSATYLRDTLRLNGLEQCYLAGTGISSELTRMIADEFGAPVRLIALRDFVEPAALDLAQFEPELTACTGVFTP
jgi:Tfp pilus assembly PilM family ATPase